MNTKKAYRRAVIRMVQRHGGYIVRALDGHSWVASSRRDRQEIDDLIASADDEHAYKAQASHPSIKSYGSRWQAAEAYCERHNLGWRVMELIGEIHEDSQRNRHQS